MMNLGTTHADTLVSGFYSFPPGAGKPPPALHLSGRRFYFIDPRALHAATPPRASRGRAACRPDLGWISPVGQLNLFIPGQSEKVTAKRKGDCAKEALRWGCPNLTD